MLKRGQVVSFPVSFQAAVPCPYSQLSEGADAGQGAFQLVRDRLAAATVRYEPVVGGDAS